VTSFVETRSEPGSADVAPPTKAEASPRWHLESAANDTKETRTRTRTWKWKTTIGSEVAASIGLSAQTRVVSTSAARARTVSKTNGSAPWWRSRDCVSIRCVCL